MSNSLLYGSGSIAADIISKVFKVGIVCQVDCNMTNRKGNPPLC